ncbi:unnamed protein product [Trichogramma brassicae]|uniref:Uncharacterized protein n=1 Tax=Trichogramma brassicae TaxID=86971 RepID=A0A6H5I7G6_9HYME|nr:unnamed protein product [Trichogramma brassicae]
MVWCVCVLLTSIGQCDHRLKAALSRFSSVDRSASLYASLPAAPGANSRWSLVFFISALLQDQFFQRPEGHLNISAFFIGCTQTYERSYAVNRFPSETARVLCVASRSRIRCQLLDVPTDFYLQNEPNDKWLNPFFIGKYVAINRIRRLPIQRGDRVSPRMCTIFPLVGMKPEKEHRSHIYIGVGERRIRAYIAIKGLRRGNENKAVNKLSEARNARLSRDFRRGAVPLPLKHRRTRVHTDAQYIQRIQNARRALRWHIIEWLNSARERAWNKTVAARRRHRHVV